MQIRLMNFEDVDGLLDVYAPFCVSEDRTVSDVSFEYEVPSREEFLDRMQHISAEYPYLVCEDAGKIIGYAYAHPYIQRAAYQWGAEVTIYLAPIAQGKGVGRVLYETLENILVKQGIVLTYACVTKSNTHSVKMHEALGYHVVGVFDKCGFKHGHWLDMVWLEKVIANHPEEPQPLRNWHSLPTAVVEEALAIANRKLA